MALTPGQLVAGKYRVERLLAEGGMGAVYVAENQVLQKRVAIKVMNEGFAAIPGATERFLREGIAASRVSHPAIVQVFDAGQHEGAPWIVMEFLEGMSLGERIETHGPLTVPELMHVCRGVLPALGAVHAQGLIHRDLKPDNIFLAKIPGGTFQPKLLDFGVAKDTRAGVNKLTATGAVVGTASYLAPEQARGAEIDARTDVYAMGAVIYEALSGSLPYEADTLTQLVAKMFTEAPVPLQQVAPLTPHAICDVVAQCLAQRPEQRFAGAMELLAALEAAASGPSVEPARGSIAFASTAMGTGEALAPSGIGVSAPSLPSRPTEGTAPLAASMSAPPSGPTPGEAQGTGVMAKPRKRSIVPLLLAGLLGAALVVGAFLAFRGGADTPQASHVPSVANPGQAASPMILANPNLPSGAATPGGPSQGANSPNRAAEPARATEDAPPTAPTSMRSTPPRHRVDRPSVAAHSPTTTPAAASAPTPPTPQVATAPAATPVTHVAPAAAPSPPALAPHTPLPRGVSAAPRAPLPSGVHAAPRAPGVPAPSPMVAPRRPPSASHAGLSAGQIAPVVNQMMPRMQRCFDRRVRRVRGLHGAIVVRFTIAGNGRVAQADAIRNGTGDAWMGRCVVQNVRRMRFPAATNGASTTISRSYRFGG